jgi:hypothetical protein
LIKHLSGDWLGNCHQLGHAWFKGLRKNRFDDESSERTRHSHQGYGSAALPA